MKFGVALIDTPSRIRVPAGETDDDSSAYGGCYDVDDFPFCLIVVCFRCFWRCPRALMFDGWVFVYVDVHTVGAT